jgi:SAM-dependent methyltransferase
MHNLTQQSIKFEDAACPLCGSAERWPVLKGRDNLYGLPGEFLLVRCLRCRHVYMNPRPTSDTIGLCYPVDYGPHQSSGRSDAEVVPADNELKTPWYLSPSVRRIPGLRRLYYWLADSKAEYIPAIETSPKRALEMGCATGQFLMQLRNEGWDATGVEPAAGPATQAVRQGFDVHVGTLESAAFADASFDAVFAWQVIEHLQEPKQTMREIHRILKPRGWIAFSVPNFACWERRFFGRCWHALELPRHLQHFTPRTLRMMLAEAGFGDVRILHQRNVLNLLMTSGIVLRRRFPRGILAQRFFDAAEHPTMRWQLALAPLAKLLAFVHQGGRLTVIARNRP